MTNRVTRCPSAKVPLRLALSVATHAPTLASQARIDMLSGDEGVVDRDRRAAVSTHHVRAVGSKRRRFAAPRDMQQNPVHHGRDLPLIAFLDPILAQSWTVAAQPDVGGRARSDAVLEIAAT